MHPVFLVPVPGWTQNIGKGRISGAKLKCSNSPLLVLLLQSMAQPGRPLSCHWIAIIVQLILTTAMLTNQLIEAKQWTFDTPSKFGFRWMLGGFFISFCLSVPSRLVSWHSFFFAFFFLLSFLCIKNFHQRWSVYNFLRLVASVIFFSFGRCVFLPKSRKWFE